MCITQQQLTLVHNTELIVLFTSSSIVVRAHGHLRDGYGPLPRTNRIMMDIPIVVNPAMTGSSPKSHAYLL